MLLTGMTPFFINAGLQYPLTVPAIDVHGTVGADPRYDDAVPRAQEMIVHGKYIGRMLSDYCDTIVLGECVPGGTTTALCVLRALGYRANVSSSFIQNPSSLKEEICGYVTEKINKTGISDPVEILRCCGDPMMPVAVGIGESFSGHLVLAGGTQMLAVSAVMKKRGVPLPYVVTTEYVRADQSANIEQISREIGVGISFVDPGFGDLGHSGLARYCIGEVKEGMGAGGAMALAHLLDYSPEQIRQEIFSMVSKYC